jgi:hypothetical protein
MSRKKPAAYGTCQYGRIWHIAVSPTLALGTIRAFTHPENYNSKLKNALNVDRLVMNIEPSVNFTAKGTELALVRLSF